MFKLLFFCVIWFSQFIFICVLENMAISNLDIIVFYRDNYMVLYNLASLIISIDLSKHSCLM
jgi:hypothetical protein